MKTNSWTTAGRKNSRESTLVPLKLSMIMVCETSDYNMLKHGHQKFNLARVIFAAPVFSKFVTKVDLRLRRIHFVLQLISYSLGSNKIREWIKLNQLILTNKAWKRFCLKLSSLELNIQRFLKCDYFYTHSFNRTFFLNLVPYITVLIVGM